MEIRDAVEADADRLAELTDLPPDVLRNVIHDRTVRVAVEANRDAADGDGDDPDRGADARDAGAGHVAEEDGRAGADVRDREDRETPVENGAAIAAFVSFDAQEDTVHVTQFGGDPGACERLLGEPLRFAEKEEMPVEVLVTADDDALRGAVEAVGFDERGAGPRFDGAETVRYRTSVPDRG